MAITIHEPNLSAAIEINTPDYAVDFYQSSIRLVWGYHEIQPKYKAIPETKLNEFLTNEQYFMNPLGLQSLYVEIVVQYCVFWQLYTHDDNLNPIIDEKYIKTCLGPNGLKLKQIMKHLHNLFSGITQYYSDIKQSIEPIDRLNTVIEDHKNVSNSIINTVFLRVDDCIYHSTKPRTAITLKQPL